jgi:hypothetical protein
VPSRIQVYGGLVHVADREQTTLVDDGARLERWLLDLARAHGLERLVDQISSDSGAGL